MQILVKDLEGVALDWAVAACQGITLTLDEDGDRCVKAAVITNDEEISARLKIGTEYSPSTDGHYAIPIINDHGITIVYADYWSTDKGMVRHWSATIGGSYSVSTSYEGENFDPCYMVEVNGASTGPTPLIAAMRCYVTQKLGSKLCVPDDLIKE